ncbi:MAG TPA: hypothetical protein PLX89_09140 [Verrucomicrobiota bacterium]|nr:hypothetical protein [Verrucomicrobiales bacterium]HRI13159.1 hypothetical protein [Verrucomicrobiota bacterium]
MKSCCVIFLSVLLWAAQCLAIVPASAVPWASPAGHNCCPPAVAVHCSAKCCVASPAMPAHSSSPISIPGAARPSLEIPALLLTRWAPPTPTLQSRLGVPETLSVAETLAVPLFLRHAAILI